jgi:hypothetical protein
MNLWFDSDHNGEYFVWQQNQFVALGGDVYAIAAACITGISNGGILSIDQTTPLSGIPGCPATTLALINANLCATIPASTNVAVWVGIDIPQGTNGEGTVTW